MRTIALTLAALALPAAAGAGAHGRHARHARRARPIPLAIALGKAHELWGLAPCDGHYRIELTRMPEGAEGHASWNSPSGFNYESPPSTWTECVMQLSRDNWTQEEIETNWPAICTIVLHEYGHLTGHPHSDEPNEPPEPPGTTQEQREVMRSGKYDSGPDLKRCGRTL